MSDGLQTLISRIDAAVRLGDPDLITRRIKRELQDAIRAGTVALPERFRQVRADGYARRLLHRNDDLGYTAVVMTWGPGQGTPLHDHAGIWCVEGVVEGRMDVTQFDLVEESAEEFRFEAKGCVLRIPHPGERARRAVDHAPRLRRGNNHLSCLRGGRRRTLRPPRARPVVPRVTPDASPTRRRTPAGHCRRRRTRDRRIRNS